jgi:hypothetical protein
MNASVSLFDLAKECTNRVTLGNIQRHPHVPGALAGVGCGLCRLTSNIGRHHLRALHCESLRDRLTHALPRTRYKCNLPREPHCDLL